MVLKTVSQRILSKSASSAPTMAARQAQASRGAQSASAAAATLSAEAQALGIGRGPHRVAVRPGQESKADAVLGATPYRSLVAGVLAGTAVGGGYIYMRSQRGERTGILN